MHAADAALRNTQRNIIQAFVTKYGNEEMLGVPMDRGFRRLSWLVNDPPLQQIAFAGRLKLR